jgi:beta-glucosidase
MPTIAFDKSFVWGAATASYQIEGAHNHHGKGESIWDRFSHTPGKICDATTGDTACNHYYLYKDDVRLMQNIGLMAYRFSVAWTRVLPSGRGSVNKQGLDFYDRLVDELLAAGIEPYVTLFHWDLPQQLQNQGGWHNRDTAIAFANYSEIVVNKLKDRVKNWITLNEPFIHWSLGHVYGIHAPGEAQMFRSFEIIHHLMLAHGLSLERIRALDSQAKVGIANALSPVYASTPADEPLVERARDIMLRLFCDPIFKGKYPPFPNALMKVFARNVKRGDLAIIQRPIDFLGINHYTPTRIRRTKMPIPGFAPVDPKGPNITEMGWEVNPDAFYDLLTWVRNEYNNPNILITENGSAYHDTVENGKVNDPERIAYYKGYLNALHRAMREGSKVNGYFVWTLLDNFEWAFGNTKRFGLYHTVYDTQERILKESGKWFANLVQNKSFDV